jgi:hypothetical protein
MTRMHQFKALWKVRTAELEAVAVLRKIRENGGYVLVDIDGGIHVYRAGRVPPKLMIRLAWYEQEAVRVLVEWLHEPR